MKLLLLILLTLCVVFSNGFVQPSQKPQHSFSILHAKKTISSKKPAAASRQNRVASLMDWAKSVADIKVASAIDLQTDVSSGLGWFAKSQIPSGSVVLTVPPNLVLSVEAPGYGPDDRTVLSSLVKDDERRTFRDLPWYAQMSLYLFKLDQVDSTKGTIDAQPWLDSLSRRFDTPIHWASLDELQYKHMEESVQKQKSDWKALFEKTLSLLSSSSNNKPSWEDFLWGCECARSRAFSGAFSGNAFNPLIYVFTLLLVTVYVGLGLGTLEQAANGAGVVVSASILNDFVFPKLFSKGKKKFIICPMIDMANHRSLGTTASVSFEYFGNAYSLATDVAVPAGEEVFISYGSRSNDQLLQYYGFVEPDNPHDVYIMPPLRDWDIQALEDACGRSFAPGRLGKLDRAGLLGGKPLTTQDEDSANASGGVVVNRVDGVDPAVLQALRALVSSKEEWEAAGEAIGNFAEPCSNENEQCVRVVAKKALEMELAAKPTTIEQDEDLLKKMKNMKTTVDQEDILAVQFRIEKKRLLQDTISRLS